MSGQLTTVGVPPKPRRLLRWVVGLLIVPVVFAGLFVWNGLHSSWQQPEFITVGPAARLSSSREVRVLTWNIAKCDFYSGGLRFRSVTDVEEHLKKMAGIIRSEKPDIVSLTEVNWECAPCPVNQAAFLARELEMHACAFGQNYSWGLPFFRIRSGNALLSRFPMRALDTEQLPGGRPFHKPVNNRRIVWCEITFDREPVLASALRNDSHNPDNNLVQVEQILRRLNGKPALMAGDFNVTPDQPAMKRWRDSGLFSGAWEGDATYPSEAPTRRIDNVLAPRGWKLVSSAVLKQARDLSDHLPVLSVFELPASGAP